MALGPGWKTIGALDSKGAHRRHSLDPMEFTQANVFFFANAIKCIS